MFRISYGIKAIGCTQYHHESYEYEDDVKLVLDRLKRNGVSKIKVYKIHKEDVTSDFISREE